MEPLPAYVSIVFVLTTLGAIGFLIRAANSTGANALPSRLLIFLLPLWLMLQGVLALGSFYLKTDSVPPRLAVFAVWPAILLIVVYFIFFRRSFIERMPLKLLTLVHVVRIPVELVLLWLFLEGQVPRMMTFEGRNFDIFSGVLAIITYFVAFRDGKIRRGLLVAFNVVGLCLLINVVSIAILSLPTPIQQLNFDQPNVAVLYFPYIWLPAIVVPIVLFAHLAALWQLLFKARSETLHAVRS